MPKISANYMFHPPQGLLTDHYLEVDDEGRILRLGKDAGETDITRYEGILCPGFINAHCHLELSFMKKQIPQGTGMTGFIGEIFAKRFSFTDVEQRKAVEAEMEELWSKGTVGIGDICNTTHSLPAKIKHKHLFTFSFIELLGLDPMRVESEMNKGQQLITEFETEGLRASISPHAPYSMSSELIREISRQHPERMSLHLLESLEERELFEKGSGAFVDFYRKVNLPYAGFSTNSALRHVIQEISTDQAILFVHNTEMTEEELDQILDYFPRASFCLCPRSNFYIHNRYPDIKSFAKKTRRICLGTDSLASNYDLDVFEEAKCIHHLEPEIPLEKILGWLTYQGARALGAEKELGSFLVGSKPGMNLIQNIDLENLYLNEASWVEKLF
ncbi:MAG: amidohydrolase family protein [Bacteroidota bacterium]